MAENNVVNEGTKEEKKGFFTKVKDSLSEFSEKHPKVTKAAKVGGKIVGGVALIFAGAFVGGVATGIKAERQKGKSEETPEENPTDEEFFEFMEAEEAKATETEEADEAPEEAPVEEQAEE